VGALRSVWRLEAPVVGLCEAEGSHWDEGLIRLPLSVRREVGRYQLPPPAHVIS
jgi:hypothetical protein